ncbi:hypothetical protein SAMN05421823_11628 [Catalinimonas alkaloidigena]|uniref:Lipoprotein n=1 Tax=Catalinimonas alkaloidigena TaxID=1075417 RepID=A0A1G9UCZ8_9BACT|nr:hypothetical protein [Catalinimonas alkaloidigena]SDM57778.1 hypothetical protein SAMN05421823_11628 [Catalinimonas alkaloidigena]
MQKYMFKCVIRIIALAGLASCGHADYNLTHDCLTTEANKMNNGFWISEMEPRTFYEEEYPKSYKPISSVHFGASSYRKEPLKQVCFKEPLEGYNWILIERGLKSDTMPLNFRPHGWYLLSSLEVLKGENYEIYFTFDEALQVSMYREPIPSNF